MVLGLLLAFAGFTALFGAVFAVLLVALLRSGRLCRHRTRRDEVAPDRALGTGRAPSAGSAGVDSL